jgi:hypothetical protein
MALVPAEFEALQAVLNDRDTRLKSLYYIKDKKGKKVLFQPNPAQLYALKNLWYLTIILKSRQHGITTFFAILYLDSCLFNPNMRAGIIAQTEDDAREIFDSKVKFAYENLPEAVKEQRRNVVDRVDKMEFSNGSSIYVDCSMRSMTLQYLHISEYGKICAKYPERSAEIVSGAFNTVAPECYITVESTAEGADGDFYDRCKKAENLARSGKKPNTIDFKFLFIGWYCDPINTLDPDTVLLTKEDIDYFEKITAEINALSDSGIIMPMPGRELSAGQKAWYVAKKEQQKEKMTQEHPSTPEEAFYASGDGKYFRHEFIYLYSNNRICNVPWEPSVPVDVSWDLGLDNYMSIWFYQKVMKENRLIRHYQGYGKNLSHYVNYILSQGYTLGTNFLPHDANHRRPGTTDDLKTVADMLHDLGIKKTHVVERTSNKVASIETAQNFLKTCWIDAVNCADGIIALENYKKRQASNGRFLDAPYHDDKGYCDSADALMCMACGQAGNKPKSNVKRRERPSNAAFY